MTHVKALKNFGVVAMFGSVFFAVVATAGLIFGFIFGGLKYLYAAVALLHKSLEKTTGKR